MSEVLCTLSFRWRIAWWLRKPPPHHSHIETEGKKPHEWSRTSSRDATKGMEFSVFHSGFGDLQQVRAWFSQMLYLFFTCSAWLMGREDEKMGGVPMTLKIHTVHDNSCCLENMGISSWRSYERRNSCLQFWKTPQDFIPCNALPAQANYYSFWHSLCISFFFLNVTQDSKLQDKFLTATHVLGIKMLLEITDQKASLAPSLLFSMHPPASQPSPPTGRVPQCVTHTHAKMNTHKYNHAHMYVCIHIIISLFAAAQNLACQTHGSVAS